MPLPANRTDSLAGAEMRQVWCIILHVSYLPLDLLRTGASGLGVELSEAQLAQFDRFARMLVDANRKFNLTRITEPEAMVTSHFLDSLICLWAQEVGVGARVIDLGTGAGFPGIPIKIARPDLRLTLIDGTHKKIAFVSQAIRQLDLEETEAVHGRAEDLAHEKTYREQYDIAYARALADMTTLIELCLPFVSLAGRVVAAKGPRADDEIDAARPVVARLGGVVEKIVRTHIPGTDIARTIPVILKTKRTPERYPRPYAAIAAGKRGKIAG